MFSNVSYFTFLFLCMHLGNMIKIQTTNSDNYNSRKILFFFRGGQE